MGKLYAATSSRLSGQKSSKSLRKAGWEMVCSHRLLSADLLSPRNPVSNLKAAAGLGRGMLFGLRGSGDVKVDKVLPEIPESPSLPWRCEAKAEACPEQDCNPRRLSRTVSGLHTAESLGCACSSYCLSQGHPRHHPPQAQIEAGLTPRSHVPISLVSAGASKTQEHISAVIPISFYRPHDFKR